MCFVGHLSKWTKGNPKKPTFLDGFAGPLRDMPMRQRDPVGDRFGRKRTDTHPE